MEFKRTNSLRRSDCLYKPSNFITTPEKIKSDEQSINSVKIIE